MINAPSDKAILEILVFAHDKMGGNAGLSYGALMVAARTSGMMLDVSDEQQEKSFKKSKEGALILMDTIDAVREAGDLP